ncbi:DNA mismatch repair protein Msh6-like [Dermacentor albipictus]|uniref:DNA mismatch repair protein Msh6-like n=1 Tax=Dermacentor albipictus TaxID=60249 RepID=UPI0038FC285F
MAKNTLLAYFSKIPSQASASSGTLVNGGDKRSSLEATKGDTGVSCPYRLHDLVWAKLEGYPYWPAMVSAPPGGGAFVKKHATQPSVHVQFFDSSPSRAWVKLRLTKPFPGPDDPGAHSSNPRWTHGVSEAKKALALDPCERVAVLPVTDGSAASNTTDEEDEQPSPKRRRVISDSSSEDEFQPGKDEDESDSDSASSGVDENTISDLEPESPEKSPPCKRPASKSPAVRKLASTKAKPAAVGAATSGTWAHLSFDFLKEGKRRDAAGRLATHPEFNPHTLHVPEAVKDKLTPAMRQWWEMKANHFDVILFFKVGKFYELYHMDAVTGVEELGLVFMKGDFAHSGFPEIAYGRYSEALIQKGYKVARVEQTETPQMMEERCRKMHRPSKFDRVVRREICRITCQATRTFGPQDGQLCNPEPAYLFAIAHSQASNSMDFGICFVDTSVGKFHLGQFSDDQFCSKLRTAVSHHSPVHVLYESDPMLPSGFRQVLEGPLHSVSRQALRPGKELWDVLLTLRHLREGAYFGDEYPSALQSFLDPGDPTHLTPQDDGCLALKALGACIWYLSESLIEEEVLTMRSFEKYVPPQANQARPELNSLILDGVSLQNLEVLRNPSGGTEGTLLATMDFCCTPFGKRLFQQWLCSPPCQVQVIEDRQRAVNDLLRFPHEVQQTRELLRSLPDLERLLARIHSQGLARNSSSHPDQRAILYEDTAYNKRKIANLLQALQGFQKVAQVVPLWLDVLPLLTSQVLARCLSVGSEAGQFPDLADSLKFFEHAFDHEQAQKEGRMTPMPGVDDDYDKAMQSIKEANKALQDYLGQQSRHFNCKASFVGSGKNRFQIEVPESCARRADSSYQLQGQRKGYRRYYTEKLKRLVADLALAEESQEAAIKDIMRRIFEHFDRRRTHWEAAIHCLALLDGLLSLAHYSGSLTDASCTPRFLPRQAQPCLLVKAGRHPCLLEHLGAATLIPNDLSLGGGGKAPVLSLLTGPNMGGKSTLMRQAGLLVIIAHMGARVPADACELTPVDRIFTRLGASDRITSGESTFFVEVNETSAILRHASQHSLVLLDELGRGTSTHDGMALAHAVVQELASAICCRTVFSTHYHHLVQGFQHHPAVQLAHMACMVEDENAQDPTQETIVFLYKCVPGPCPKSYGFNAAKLAGISQQVIKRAFQKSQSLQERIEVSCVC